MSLMRILHNEYEPIDWLAMIIEGVAGTRFSNSHANKALFTQNIDEVWGIVQDAAERQGYSLLTLVEHHSTGSGINQFIDAVVAIAIRNVSEAAVTSKREELLDYLEEMEGEGEMVVVEWGIVRTRIEEEEVVIESRTQSWGWNEEWRVGIGEVKVKGSGK